MKRFWRCSLWSCLLFTVVAHASIRLEATTKTIQVDGKSVKVDILTQADGTWGFYGYQGDRFQARVENKLKEATVIHWHGLIVPNDQDGTPINQALIEPKQGYDYSFKLNHAGTYWMHSHQGYQVQNLLAAPLIVYPKGYDPKNDIVMMFQDFSFTAPEKILHHLQNSSKSMHMNMQMDMKMGSEAMDLNDVDYDAFLTNYHTPQDPLKKMVKPGEHYRLRLINAAAGTNFHVQLGRLTGTLVAIDGNAIVPLKGKSFEVAVAQRLDIDVTIPTQGGVFPILGQVEGKRDQTGMLLYTPGHKVGGIPNEASRPSSAFSYDDLLKMHSAEPFKAGEKKPDQKIDINLAGDMSSYHWTINGQTWPKVTPIKLKQGQVVQFNFINHSGMAHPMHLHGQTFQVIAIDGHKISHGPLRDTIEVLPHSRVSVVFKAQGIGKWFLHCHLLYHEHAGMMTYIQVV